MHNLARKILINTRNRNIQLLVLWKRRTEEEMVRADLDFSGLWLVAEEFQLDY